MSDPTWPMSLPSPSLNGYNVNDKLPLLRTEMEGGPARVSRINTSYESLITFSLVVDAEQASTFRSFFENAINAGADWFTMPLDSGTGVAYHRARIMSVGFAPISDKIKRISCQVEIDARVSGLG